MGKKLKVMGTVSNNLDIKISAIVPVYNVKMYLRQCVDSLLAQTYPFFEIILVDDGSTDGCSLLCDELAAAYAQVHSVHKENAGLGYARNTGLDNLSELSDYVMFIDSDDWLEANAVECLLAAIQGDDVDCVIGGHTKKDCTGKTQFVFQMENAFYNGEKVRDELIPRLCGSAPAASDSIPMSAWSSLFRADCIREKALRFPSERNMISEDFVFKFNFLLHADRVVVSDFTQYCYRTNQGSLTTSYRPDRFEASMHFYREALRMIRQAALSQECITRLQKTLFIYVRMCIHQETPSLSGKRHTQCIAKLKSILGDGEFHSVLSEFPSSELHLRQRLFVFLLKNKAAFLIFWLNSFGLI